MISWKNLVEIAQNAVQGERIASKFVKGGYVATALLTDKDNVYTGINFDARCALGTCSERYTLHKVFEANKDEKIIRCVCIYRGEVHLPCGACRELFMQYGNGTEDMEILLDIETEKTVKLKDTMSSWWGESKNKQK